MISPLFVTHNRSLIEIICVSEGLGTRRIILVEKRPCAPLGGHTMVCAYEQVRLLITYFSNKLFSKRYRIVFASKAIGASWHKDVMYPPSTTHNRVSLSSSRCCPLWRLLILSEETGGALSFTVALTLFSVVYNRNSYRTVSSRANFVRNNSTLFMVLIR